MSAFSRREFLKTGLGAGVGLAASAAFPTSLSAEASPPSRRVILLILDGLRPDSVTPELMPHTHQLASRGVFFADNHAVYPMTTMMNAAALATGSYPDKAGLRGNIPWTPGATGTNAKGEALDYNQPVDIDDWANVVNLDRLYGGRLLLAPTLFQEAQKRGLTTYTSGKSDPAFLFDLKRGGMLVDEHTVSPRALATELLVAGERLPKNTVVMWPDLALPAMSALWIRDPDTTQHWYGPGSGPLLRCPQASRRRGRRDRRDARGAQSARHDRHRARVRSWSQQRQRGSRRVPMPRDRGRQGRRARPRPRLLGFG